MSTFDLIVSLINLFDDESSYNTTNTVNNTCICGAILESSPTRYIELESSSISCNICKSIDRKTSVSAFYSCVQKYNIHHPDGYNVCNKCITEVTEVTEHKNDEQVRDFNKPSLHKICEQSMTCPLLQQLLKSLQAYDINSNTMENIEQRVTDAYLHVLNEHSDDDFAEIYNKLQRCNIIKCTKFKRKNRNRMLFDKNIQFKTDVLCDTMDTIHCYFHHSYDLGYRLSQEEKQKIETEINDSKYDEQDIEHLLRDHNRFTVIKMIAAKQEQFAGIINKFKTDTFYRYNQLFVDEKLESDDTFYEFGYELKYDYPGEYRRSWTKNWVTTYPHFKNLKEEFFDNPYVVLTTKQYENEFRNAKNKFSSQYCKSNKYFQSFEKEYNQIGGKYLYKKVIWEFKLEYVLAMIVYCNYDQLQYYFSKTYRENRGRNHTYFYHWGKALKISIQEFGTNISEGKEKAFYHGINQKLYFSRYLAERFLTGLHVNCPLSTTSSFEISARFATNYIQSTKGLIVEFCDSKIPTISGAKYLSLAWLSNFPEEKEFLFVQMNCMQIADILDITTNINYEFILKAMDIIHGMVTWQHNYKNIHNDIQQLTVAIFEDQLSRYSTQYKQFKSLTSFAKDIIDFTFEDQTELSIHYWRIRKYASFAEKYLIRCDYEWINLELLLKLFPSVTTIRAGCISLCCLIFDDILKCLNDNTDSCLMKVELERLNATLNMSVKQTMLRYSASFRQLNMFIYEYTTRREIIIEKCSKAKFVMKMIDSMNELYFVDTNGEIESYMETLLKNRVSEEDMYETYDEDELEFNEWCDNYSGVIISWKSFSQNKESFLYKLLKHPNVDGWVNLQKLKILFPNVGSLFIECGNLSDFIIEDIYQYIVTCTESSLSNVVLDKSVGDLNVRDAKNKYEQRFECQNWLMDASESEKIGDCLEFIKKA
eukprot:503416_1